MLSGRDLKEFNGLSKDDTIALAYAGLAQIRELILALDEIDEETYEQLYQFATTSLQAKLDHFEKKFSRYWFSGELRREAFISVEIIEANSPLNEYQEFFEYAQGYFYHLNVGAFAPYLKNKNDDGCDEARMILSWEMLNEEDDGEGSYDSAANLFYRWKVDWAAFKDTMLHDEKKSNTFLKTYSQYIAAPNRNDTSGLSYEGSRFSINNKVYIIILQEWP